MRTIAIVMLLAMSLACTKQPTETATQSVFSDQAKELAAIPPADPTKYPNWHDLRDWKNPYLVVREDGIGYVDMANNEIRILKPEDIPSVLAALPESAWPYGRVVLVSQATPKDSSDQAKAEIRKNRGLLIGTLDEVKVQVHEAP